ncbi:MAG: hypothetical protein ACTHJL_12660 [Amnibacterium sp.]
MNVLGDARAAQRILWAATGLATVAAAGTGLILPSIYDRLVPAALLPGVYGQDAVGAVVGAALLTLAVPAEPAARRDLTAIGLAGYLGYAYGILVIERVTNPLYLDYLAVFAGAVWSLVLAVAGIRRTGAAPPLPPRWARFVSTVGAVLQPLVFVPLWIVALLPVLAARRPEGALLAVSVLDLGFVMPAFVVTAVLLALRRPSGSLLAPPMFVLGAVLMGSLTVAALTGPLFGVRVTAGDLLPSSTLALVLAALAAVSLLGLGEADDATSHRAGPSAVRVAR